VTVTLVRYSFLLWKPLWEKGAFELGEYRSGFKKLKYVKPGKIFDLIDKK
jgi:hypothetical protein